MASELKTACHCAIPERDCDPFNDYNYDTAAIIELRTLLAGPTNLLPPDFHWSRYSFLQVGDEVSPLGADPGFPSIESDGSFPREYSVWMCPTGLHTELWRILPYCCDFIEKSQQLDRRVIIYCATYVLPLLLVHIT